MVLCVPFLTSNTVVADEPEPSPYDYVYGPGGQGGLFGCNQAKVVNWTFFKALFNAHTRWILEYKSYSSSVWTNGASYLTIQKTWNSSGFWKFNLILDVPVNVYSVRFSFGCDLPCLQYVERSGTEVWVNYSANATEEYSCMFNWSDIAGIPGLVITKGKTDNLFWFRFQRDNVPAGHYEFDPVFGSQSVYAFSSSVENKIRGYIPDDGLGLIPFNLSYNGYVINMSAYLTVTTASHNVTLAIYQTTRINTPTVLMGQTEYKIVPVGASWVTFSFDKPYPHLLSGVYYDLCAWSNASSGDCRVMRPSLGLEYQAFYKELTYTGSYPDPMSGYLLSTSRYSMYCTFIPEPVISSIYPVNTSGVYRNVTVSAVASWVWPDHEAYVYKKINVGGTYWLDTAMSSLVNQTIYSRWFNASSYSDVYYWEICIKNKAFGYWSNHSYCFVVNNSSVTTYNHTVNSTQTVQKMYNHTIGWSVFLNSTGNTTAIHQLSVIVNATGTHSYILNGTGYWDTASYTGNTTPIHTSDTKKNVSGSVSYSLNGTGYWVNSSHESILTQFLNLINATGTHQKAWDGSQWLDWANVTGNGTSCGNTSLSVIENLANVTGGYYSVYNFTTGWTVQNNYTGLNALNFIEHLVNATGGHQQYWNGTTWNIYNNYTGNITAIHQLSVIVNATGTHSYILNGTGYWDTASYTGNTTPIHTSDTKKNVSGSVSYSLNGTGYWVNSSHESILTQFLNLINATGTHQKAWDGSQWLDWANVTGNNSAFVNVTRLLPIGSGSSSSLIMMGMVFGSSGLMLFGMRRRRKRNQ
jgi:hypothetical protein